MAGEEADASFPAWPPGFWRRITVRPGDDVVVAALEDDIHAFLLRLEHSAGRITGVHGKALRHPWTACPGAVDQLRELTGAGLDEVRRRDPGMHCTHLLELAALAASHAGLEHPVRYDMTVADRIDGRTTARLEEEGAEALVWRLDGMTIVGPERLTGRDLWRLAAWKGELPPREAMLAGLLRRAVFVSGGRSFTPPPGRFAVDQANDRLGVCYNYQLPQAAVSERVADWRIDFSAPGHAPPLAGIDADAIFATMRENS